MPNLTLSRKLNESVVIFVEEQQIFISIEKLTKKEVRLNFEADISVDIWRDELLEPEDPDPVE
jgi:carbon storage regulator CsrA